MSWFAKLQPDMSRIVLPVGYTPKDCDGCGTGWNEKIVPDSIYWLNIQPVCCIHDWRYGQGGDEAAFHRANLEFLENLLAVIEAVDKWWYPTTLARNRAMTYYNAVEELGLQVFLANNKKEQR